MDARCRLIEIAAFLDRMDRASGEGDYRWDAFKKALAHLSDEQPERARQVLMALSDPTLDPVEKAPGKGASGAYAA